MWLSPSLSTLLLVLALVLPHLTFHQRGLVRSIPFVSVTDCALLLLVCLTVRLFVRSVCVCSLARTASTV